MPAPSPRPNSVTALRERNRHPRNSAQRRLLLRTLLLVSVAAAVAAGLMKDRQVRAWSAVVAVIGLVIAAVAWLGGKSRTLSDSGRDPQDFTIPPGSL